MSVSSSTVQSRAGKYDNPDRAHELYDKLETEQRQERAQRRQNATIKQQLQQARADHTFTVEMYGVEMDFNPLPKEAADELEGKRTRMAHCAQNGNWDELAEQADYLDQKAPEWLEEAWNGDEPMFADDWTDIYDSDELLELLNKVDQRGEGAEAEAVVQFLGE